MMVGLPQVLYVTLVLICIGSQVESDASNQRYNKGDIVPFYANKVGPLHNPQETYAYYDLPFCSPETLIEKKLTLGEMLNGDRLISAPYKLEFLVDKDSEVLCSKKLSKSDVSQLRSVIEKDYYEQMYYDDLPIWAFIGETRRNYTDERIKNQYFLYKHYMFEVFYNKDRVIKVTCKRVHDSLVDLTDDKEVNVNFTYSIKWSFTEQSFNKRMEKYIIPALLPHHLSIHRHSIAYSSVAIFILIICLVVFYVLVLHKDISKILNDVEEDQVDDNQEETGWKKIHGDVFRFPKHKSFFAAALGSGTHLLLLIASVLVMGLMGYFQPYVRGVFWNALVIAYAVTSVVSGYTSVSFYSQLEGTTWMKNLLLTAGVYFGPLFLTFSFLNSVAIFYGVTAALPLGAIVILFLLLIFLALPLLLLGGFVGKNIASDFHAELANVLKRILGYVGTEAFSLKWL